MQSINKNSTIKLSPSILKRYEHNVDAGILFLFNAKTNQIYKGNILVALFVNLLDGKKNLADIYCELKNIFPEQSEEEIYKGFDCLIKSLIDKNFLEYE